MLMLLPILPRCQLMMPAFRHAIDGCHYCRITPLIYFLMAY